MIKPSTHELDDVLPRTGNEVLMGPTVLVPPQGCPFDVAVTRVGDRVIGAVFHKAFVEGIAAFMIAKTAEKLQEAHPINELVVVSDGFEPNALRLIDEATGGTLAITPVSPRVNPDFEAALAALPRAKRREPVPLVLSISEYDFDNLVRLPGETNSAAFVRFRALNPGEAVGNGWRYSYFMNESWAGVMMARAFLDHHEIAYQVAQDTDDEWVILTDFASAELLDTKARETLKAQFRMAEKITDFIDKLQNDAGTD